MNNTNLPAPPEGLELPPEKFGTLINNEESKVETEWDMKVKEIETPISVTMRLTGSQLTRLKRICSDGNKTMDEYVQEQIIEELENSVGAGVITAPTFAKQKVRGFTGSVRRG